jgi:hypothetical protein
VRAVTALSEWGQWSFAGSPHFSTRATGAEIDAFFGSPAPGSGETIDSGVFTGLDLGCFNLCAEATKQAGFFSPEPVSTICGLPITPIVCHHTEPACTHKLVLLDHDCFLSALLDHPSSMHARKDSPFIQVSPGS